MSSSANAAPTEEIRHIVRELCPDCGSWFDYEVGLTCDERCPRCLWTLHRAMRENADDVDHWRDAANELDETVGDLSREAGDLQEALDKEKKRTAELEERVKELEEAVEVTECDAIVAAGRREIASARDTAAFLMKRLDDVAKVLDGKTPKPSKRRRSRKKGPA